MTSLRNRLLAGLLALIVALTLLVAGLTYRRFLAESSDLFDYQLRQMALSLRNEAALGAHIDLTETGSDFVVQIWDPYGARVYQSHPGQPFIDRAILGYADLVLQGKRWRVYSLQVEYGVIQVAQPWSVRERLAGRVALRSVLPLVLLLPLMGVAIMVMVGQGLSPLRRVASEVQQRDANSLNALDTSGIPREVAPLVGELNRLLARLAEAFRVQRDFIADAAHELRSPLTALHLQMQLLERASDEDGRREALARLREAIDRAIHLAAQLLTLARHEPESAQLPMQAVSLADAAREGTVDAQGLAQQRGTELELRTRSEGWMRGDATSLRTLVRNLVDNAIRYTPQGGRVEIDVSGGADGSVCLWVDDTGPGIPVSDRERALARFYRRAGSTEGGTGLGLSIVKAIVERHDGRLQLGESLLGGLRVEVVFPGAARPPRALPAP